MSGGSVKVSIEGRALGVSILIADTTRVPTVTVGSKTIASMPYTIAADTTFVVAEDGEYDIAVTEGNVTVYSVSISLANNETWTVQPDSTAIRAAATYTTAIGSTATIPSTALYRTSDLTLTAATTLTFPDPGVGKNFNLFLRQDQVGGRVVTWPTVTWATGVAPTLGTTVTSGNQNLLTANQSNVETDTTGLTSAAYSTTTLARTTAGGTYENGSAAASLTPTGTVVVGVTTLTGTSGVAVTAGQRYTAVASTKSASTAAAFRVAIAWYAGATLLSTSVGPAITNSSSAFTQCTVSAVAPYGATYAAVKVYSNATTAVVHYVDSIGLWKTNVAPYLALSGSSGSYASTPDASPVSITGDIDIRVKANLADWTPSAAQDLVSKYGQAGNKSFRFYVDTDGTLNLATTAAGTTMLTATSTAAPTVSNAADLWVRTTLDCDNGSSQHVVKFYTSADGVTWTQLGSTVTVATANSIFDGTAPLEIGSNTGGTANNLAGRIYRVILMSGIAGTTVFDADFTTQAGEYFQESSSYAAWVTVYGRATWAVGGASAVAPELLEFTSDGASWFGARPVTIAGLDARYLLASIPTISVNSAPADGSIATGSACLWFDSSNGAAKLMIKAKQADGSVKTGSVNVAT